MNATHPYLAVRLISGALLLAGCRHDALEEPKEVLPAYTVQQRLAVVWRYGGHAYELNSEYQDDFGHLFRLDTLRFLISGARALDDHENVLAQYSNVYAIADASTSNDFLLGDLTSDHLHVIGFSLGFEPDMNHADPAQAPAPLNDMSMHTGDNAMGYCFLYLAGLVDSNNDGALDGSDQRFSHRCAGDALLCPAAAVVHANLPEGGALTANLPVEMEILLSDIDLLNTPSTMGDGPVNMAWMQRLMDSMDQEH